MCVEINTTKMPVKFDLERGQIRQCEGRLRRGFNWHADDIDWIGLHRLIAVVQEQNLTYAPNNETELNQRLAKKRKTQTLICRIFS